MTSGKNPQHTADAAVPLPQRLADLDLAKGLAILLVVWGHIVAGAAPRDNDWYTWTQEAVYLFHMPFFMFLSGVVAGYGYRVPTSADAWGGFVRGKMERLLPAYALIAMLVVVGKLVASRFVFVDNLPPSLAQGLLDVFLQPNKSAAKSLWFIYVLFLFYLTLHGWMWIVRQRAHWLIFVGLVLEAVPAPDWLLLNRYCQFFLFFALGLNAGQHYNRWHGLLDRGGAWWGLLFVAGLLLSLEGILPIGKVTVGLLSIPGLMWAVRSWLAAGRGRFLLMLGQYSFVIYLLNTICIGLAKGIGFKLVRWDGPPFLIYAPALFLAGLLLPVWIKRHIFKHIPALDRITR